MKNLAPFAAEVAPHVDRLVLAVHRQMRAVHGDEVAQWRADSGLETPGILINLRPFVLEGSEARWLAERFHRYAVPATFDGQLENAVSAGVFTSDFTATEKARMLATRLTDLQRDLMTELWTASSTVDSVTPILERVVDDIPNRYHGDAFGLANAWVGLNRPNDREYRLHHLLTALRYLRADCHSEILQEAELTPGEAARLDAAWRVQEGAHHDHPLENLVLRGLVTPEGDMTEEGVAYRRAIEDETNSAAGAAWAGLSEDERQCVMDGLAQVPDHPAG